MRKVIGCLLWVMLISFGVSVKADKTYQAYPFETTQDSARFHELLTQLRCMVCQNQSLADSDAVLAQDLRQKVYEMVQAGDSDETIISYLQTRYGEFILLAPVVTHHTYLLWLGPLVLLLAAVALGARAIYRIHQRYKVSSL